MQVVVQFVKLDITLKCNLTTSTSQERLQRTFLEKYIDIFE